MSNPEACCPFCDTTQLLREERVIRSNGSRVLSIMSNPRFREFHGLVIPTEHAAELSELGPDLMNEFIQEIALVQSAIKKACQERARQQSLALDVGALIVMKPEPVPTEGIVSVPGHLHAHIYPFVRPGDVKIPAPRSDDDFSPAAIDILRQERDEIRQAVLEITSDPVSRPLAQRE